MKTIADLRSEFGSDEQFGQAILREVEKLAKENPDYVYEYEVINGVNTYSYTCGANGSKGCLIGQALQKLGVFLEDKNTSFRTILLWNNMNFDESPSLKTLTYIQSRQDDLKKWGECING